ncbi:MAG: hypothetical protein A2X22_10150 [Bacteroidetes bacterium GWF2_49_14]|nr:MAG: hypothetical protein A2X22_10150 [Bacteroidetes bacterium GWF2_49_14]
MILNLAGFIIKVVVADSQDYPRLSVNHASLLSRGQEDFTLEIRYSDPPFMPERLMGFAPMEMDLPRLTNRSAGCFWKMNFDGINILLSGTFPEDLRRSPWEMTINPDENTGFVRVSGSLRNRDPLSYPVDALLIYYLGLFNGGSIIHSSGIDFQGCGFLFAGPSGIGKSTIARYCQLAGARVLHDDRILVRRCGDTVLAFRMPVYPGSLPASMQPEKIFFIEQSEKIYEIPLPDQVTFELLAGHAVQHPFHSELITRQVANIASIVKAVPGFRLGFPADPQIGRYLKKQSLTGREPVAGGIASLPDSRGLQSQTGVCR